MEELGQPVRNTMEKESEFRGRVLEVLELIADGEAQLEYQRRVPYVDVASELFNQWDDSYHPGDACFHSQFDSHELAALAVFGELVDGIAGETPQQLPALEEFMRTTHWQRLADGASTALGKMNRTRRNGLAPG
jgi:hypothetical protein